MIDALLLYNPAAGRRPLSPERLGALLAQLRERGVSCEPVMSSSGVPHTPLDLRNKKLLLVYGGDGTIHQAIQQLPGTSVRLALLPAGTANVLARELGIPIDTEKALDIALGAKVRRIHLGRSGDHYFHLMAGVGLDAFIIEQVSLRLKKAFGIGAFWIGGLLAFRKYQLPQFEVDLDGEKHTGTFAVIANARNYGGSLVIAPSADLSDDRLDVCIFTSRRKLRFFRYLAAAITGRHVQYPDVIYRKAREVRVTGADLPVQMDGEIIGRLPRCFSRFTGGIDVLVP